jgi:predicted alpha-1,2-mannosidase
MKKSLILICSLLLWSTFIFAQQKTYTAWSIGKPDNSPNEFALAPNGFKNFVGKDFGYEDKFYLVNYSQPKTDFPYVLPGIVDTWGGTYKWSGWRNNNINIFFGLKNNPQQGNYKLVIKLSDFAKTFLPMIKLSVNNWDKNIQLTANGYNVDSQAVATKTEPTIDSLSILGNLSKATPKTIEIPINASELKQGGNAIHLTILRGSWIMFDAISLESDIKVELQQPYQFFVREVKPAKYEIENDGKKFQPLLINVVHLKGVPKLTVLLDDEIIFNKNVEQGNYDFEVPMPAVSSTKNSRYKILENGKLIESRIVKRTKQKTQTAADYVDTRLGTAHSRWMIAPGPWMPFSMVKISPDNQNASWQAGYDPIYESIGTFSHIHEWTMSGLGIFASNGKLKINIGDELNKISGYRSSIDKRKEKAEIGLYEVTLTDYNIKAEVTATTRCSFQRFTFPKDRDSSRILIDLQIPAENNYQLKEIQLKKVSAYKIEGFAHQYSPNVWSRDAEQDYTIYFVIEFEQPIINLGGWLDSKIMSGDFFEAKDVKNAGLFVHFDSKTNPVVQVRSGISLVSIANATENLNAEVEKPFGWDFEAVRQNNVNTWNDIFNRVKITSNNRLEKLRFYNSVYRSICSRNTWSDVNGQWRGTDGKVQQLKNKDDVALGGDAFWNSFWNSNQLWNLITPEWSNRWVNSQLALYNAYGWTAKGPAGMNYIPVMVASHELQQMISAYQMGIRNFDANKVLEAAVKMQTTPAQKLFKGFVGNRDLTAYLKYHYVPSDSGRFSNSMEYSFDDWTVGQMAKALGKIETYNTFNNRGYWWKNTIDTAGFSHLKLSNGKFTENFNPFRSGANEQYVEGNAWQLTFFVPQDVPALIDIIGKQKFVDRLEWGFAQSEPWRYNGMNDQYWDYPVVQGNEQSMHFAYLFNWAGKPWQTQKWSRSIIDRYYGFGPADAYLGDEDQGQMSAWLVMSAIGLFQTDGGGRVNPIYEIGSPLYPKIEIDLGKRFGRGKKFIIEAKNASRLNKYIQHATLNGKTLHSFHFPASELLQGGSLVLKMGSQPNKQWGLK